MLKSQITSLYCNAVSLVDRLETLGREEAGEGHMVSVVGIAAAVGLGIAAAKPLVEAAFANGAGLIDTAITTAGS